jgi:hypothetical protein
MASMKSDIDGEGLGLGRENMVPWHFRAEGNNPSFYR